MSIDELTREIKRIRVSIDGDIKALEMVQAHRTIADQVAAGGPETDAAIFKLKEGKMWLGQVLGQIGHRLPEEYRDEAQSSEKAVQFDPHKQPWPDGVVLWSIMPYQPRDGSWGYVDTSSGRVHIQAGDWIVTDANGKRRVEKRANQ